MEGNSGHFQSPRYRNIFNYLSFTKAKNKHGILLICIHVIARKKNILALILLKWRRWKGITNAPLISLSTCDSTSVVISENEVMTLFCFDLFFSQVLSHDCHHMTEHRFYTLTPKIFAYFSWSWDLYVFNINWTNRVTEIPPLSKIWLLHSTIVDPP